MTHPAEHIAGYTLHSRHGEIQNAFRYNVDYVLIDPDDRARPALFSRNGFNLASVHDLNHGGLPKQGRGAVWANEVLSAHGMDVSRVKLLLLTQPRFLGYVFNPVSFWLAMDGADLCAVIAEVNNTFGDRHSYLCHLPGFAPIAPSDQLISQKVMHVSPYQQVEGDYSFNFAISPERLTIRIIHRNGPDGLTATLAGARMPLTNRSILSAAVRRPCGALRTIALIYWQAMKLKFKGAQYRTRPTPPQKEVS
ncbi:DUF1365 domain-containing protein [Actibacterium lipolyticum]|uniref:DUF1365 domain-containing protein n=1 Tax=Actibacterium lipolyticum TaxID=1524263 RepID=A0A238KPH4_9RHOB|nr:DUF1365 domain-containing protein [Actibacterium lipolyticum]SMX44764.1 hypothetical protein COL8621_02627 [Actibacterium lipolyticum]